MTTSDKTKWREGLMKQSNTEWLYAENERLTFALNNLADEHGHCVGLIDGLRAENARLKEEVARLRSKSPAQFVMQMDVDEEDGSITTIVTPRR